MFKKILTLIIAALMLVIPVSADFTDVADNKYEEEITLLNTLGIVEGKEDGQFKPEDTLTRAEMTTIVLRLLGTEGLTASTFSDVPKEHWASLIIGTAAQMNIVNGVSETEFAPEEAVTYPQAVKMLVCALGYEVQAQAMGGYPTGYLVKATQLGLLDETTDDSQPISRAMMAKLVANALEANILVRTAYGDAYTYEEKENATLLNTYMGIEQIEGRVTANAITNLGGTAAGEGEFSIGEIKIQENNTNGGIYIGRTVTVYAKEENDIYTALSVVPKYQDGYKEIDAEDIMPTSTLLAVYYEATDKKIEEKKIASDAVWVYNGSIKTDMTADDLIFDIGTVRLICENNTVANIVFVESYKNMIVNTVRTDTGRITFKNPSEGMNEITLDKSNSFTYFTLTNTEGKNVPLEDVREWDILSISKGDNVYQIRQCYESVGGKVTEISQDRIKIDDKEYEVAANVYRNKEVEKPSIGMEANFILDFTGRIAAIDTEEYKDYKYGYIVSAAKEEGLSNKELVKVFTEDGEMQIFYIAENFRLNDISCKSIFSREALELCSGGKAIEQLIRYKANSDGELFEVETALDIKDIRDTFNETARLEYFTEEVFYESGSLYGAPTRMYEFKYLLRGKTKVFKVPEKYNGKDDEYSLIDPMSIGHVSSYGGLPSLTLYDIDEDEVISAMVTKGSGKGGTVGPVGVITNISQALNEEGVPSIKVNVLNESGETSFFLKEDVIVNLGQYALTDVATETEKENGKVKETIDPMALDVGDVIWYVKPDFYGETSMIRVILRADSPLAARRTYRTGADLTPRLDKDGPTKGQVSAYDGTTFTFGEVLKVSDYAAYSNVATTLDGSVKSNVAFSYEGSYKVYLYDRAQGTFTTISTDEIRAGDKIFTQRYNLKELYFVIYR